jgi:hypothetical protein
MVFGMEWPLSRSWLLVALLVMPFGCTSKKRALENVDCSDDVAPHVTNIQMNDLGIGTFACIRLSTHDERTQSLVESHCRLCEGPMQQTTYPAQSNPRATPTWWDLQDGDSVEYAARVARGGNWRGFVYRKRTRDELRWFMCASGD